MKTTNFKTTDRIQRGWLRGDLCLTPMGRSAKVIGITPEGRVEVAYVGRPLERVTLHPELLRSIDYLEAKK